MADMRRPGRPSVSEEEVYALTALLDSDRRHTIRELARDRISAYDCASHSEGTPGREKNCITMGSACFDGNAEIATIRRCS